MVTMTEKEIISILAETGPLTGAQLVERTGMEVFSLWQICRRTPAIYLETTARLFLRLDRSVHGYARLSPSIRREFLTYTFVGLNSQIEELAAKAAIFKQETKDVSQAKREVAEQAAASALVFLSDKDIILTKACFIIAGDIVYDMSHTVSRPEKSTGEMVRGSDLDIVVVAEDDLAPEIVRSLDNSIHKRKHFLLVNDREEIDYLIKSMSRVREQLEFDIFSSMVAAKILNEGQLLYGNPAVYQTIRNLIVEYGIPARLKSLEQQAAKNRKLAEAQLLDVNAERERGEYLNLFYTHAEEDEIY
jgi:hypothetical protein